MKRRTFITTTALGLPAIGLAAGAHRPRRQGAPSTTEQLVVSTWNFAGANEAAYRSLSSGAPLLDAVEAGIRVVEADRSNTTVGIGGYPDRDGHLTLDASIMEGTGRCGSVVFMEGIDHPISVARAVMEKSPHVMLAGDGATQFAREEGFTYRKELTPGARKAYEEWLKTGGYRPRPIGEGNHDTIGLLVLRDGKMAGGCSTSGAAWKMHGRVGDSPIVGAGLFVDNEVGCATSTGLGEAVIRIAGSVTVVELMRQGATPVEACREAIERIMAKQPQYGDQKGFLAAFLAVSSDGRIGAWGCGPGFEYAVMRGGTREVVRSEYSSF
jgi:N4-(beta-N-acetylglucosaminyl)-L-asparaginase